MNFRGYASNLLSALPLLPRIGLEQNALVAANASQIFVVAGAGFDAYLEVRLG